MSDPWVGKISGEGNGNPLQYSCLGNPTDRGARQAIVHGVAKSQTRLSVQHFHAHDLHVLSSWSPGDPVPSRDPPVSMPPVPPPCEVQGQSSALLLPDFSLPFDTGVDSFLWETLHVASGTSWSLAPLLATSHSPFWDLPLRASSREARDPNHSRELKGENSSSQILY